MSSALYLAEDNRIRHACEVLPHRNYKAMPIVEVLPEGDITDYLYVNGEYVYDPQPRPEPEEPETEPTVWDELDAAYQEGYDEGYSEGVNSAYDE